MSDAVRALLDAEQLWVDALAQVGPAALDRRSGADGWTNRDLINHVTGGGHRYAMLLAGASAGDVETTRDSDYIVDDPVGEFWCYETMLRESAAAADLSAAVDHRAGQRSGDDLLIMRAMDLALHTHDLCVGIGIRWEPSDDLVEYLLSDASPLIEELRGLGLFGAALECADTDSASAADRLLAFSGRAR
ncbi:MULTISPECIES: maleylpyruvate isomerase N-terminal domain-containing protein [unclassified Gordonia (in: high G+C Gram-positive bacteria)]|uniref:maleylpyruvate isomerase N-terminal domain-containing protein n=1 Tax=unclassified Gordonia (in: high G+C Gram-positive bacteria) TaxID=2657482 RepID=UPI0007E98909|nr:MULTISPECIES: maleylpyruvate isomerase N-terminal domain-containing protein [unclassified Gordonia (in: high G+C Gram-positive bacteria)]OBC05207.1 hypothetical protein A5785_01235 [Gordonia sp. 852002-50395_SCH5434458]OBC12882.1 hypothetical protein A5786_01100 [Gordonia sp. 852002-50816_SCH5313054-a]OBC18879.1 hypothetical protein A5788_01625 [Gordonia sp. 852002-50816_SCH5313054-c]